MTPAGDTAPDDEPLTFEQAVQHVDWNLNAPRADAAIAALYRGLAKVRELDRLRSEAAALRAAGNTLAETTDEAIRQWRTGIGPPTTMFALVDAATAWRSAAGSPATEVGEPS